MSLGKKIQELRKQNNLSQEQLAEKLLVSRQAVSKWELDQSVPDTDKVILLSDLFKISTDYLLRKDINISLPQSLKENLNEKSIVLDTYKQFLGRWVKIFLDDKVYEGIYETAIIAMDNDYIMFQDKKSKRGIVAIESIISVSDADIYKRKQDNIPEVTLQEETGTALLEYFKGKRCKIRFKCKSIFTKPQGYFDVLVERITCDEVCIDSKGSKSIIKLDRILFIEER
ncbi:helix-turn-helix transcriptional regulator [Clostridium sp. YIM B02505]|uniref:Helix-turn-helix transcriptional regulator n=1 Tax=Clostridium yunnanense TaxID=2800325 RepID=A0ABS1EW82_9CLOT|nr:helix-turn-helix transcriptional regulator [Clostridium yunnanense]MBK1813596.1 helix-turn-helix transcriptional regulator [Clostridium yunnanense]